MGTPETPTDNWEKEKYAALLTCAKEAISRSRYVFAVMNAAVLLVLAAEYNLTFAWIRNAVGRVNTDTQNTLNHLLLNDLWVISIPILGIKISGFDLSFVGSMGMVILSMWLFYCVRRENHVVRTIMQEATIAFRTGGRGKAEYLYHGVVHQLVFATGSGPDKPGIGVKTLARILLYAPIIALFCVLMADASSLLGRPAFLGPGYHACTSSLWCEMSVQEKLEVIVRSMFCIAALVFCAVQCRQSVVHEDGMIETIHSLRVLLEPNTEAQSREAARGKLWLKRFWVAGTASDPK